MDLKLRNGVALVGLALLAGCPLVGCKTDSATRKAENLDSATSTVQPAPAPASPAPIAMAPAFHGTISGSVSFTGTAPKPVKIDTTMDPACEISSPKPVFSEQYAVANGKLGNVFVYVKSGPPAAMQAGPVSTAPIVLDQKGCQYVPHIIAVMAGGSVEFHNSDVTMHNIHTMPAQVGNETIDISQSPRGAAVTKQFAKPELMIPVRCNNHPWMNAFINVSQTPFFAISDASGHFSIAGLPPGDYFLGAVHEKLGEKELHITIPANGAAKADFSFAAR